MEECSVFPLRTSTLGVLEILSDSERMTYFLCKLRGSTMSSIFLLGSGKLTLKVKEVRVSKSEIPTFL